MGNGDEIAEETADCADSEAADAEQSKDRWGWAVAKLEVSYLYLLPKSLASPPLSAVDYWHVLYHASEGHDCEILLPVLPS